MARRESSIAFLPLPILPSEAAMDFWGNPARFIQSTKVYTIVRPEKRWDNWLDKSSKELRKDTV